MSKVKELRPLGFFEWVVVDNCNLRCSYCVNKGAYSHKNAVQMQYIPDNEVVIAKKILDFSKDFEKVIVNLTGGEPTLAVRLEDALKILVSAGNIEIRLITNLRAVKRFKKIVPYISRVMVSIHISLRSDREIQNIISVVTDCKSMLPITLSQVDYLISCVDYAKLNDIQKKTGIPIQFLPYIHPWSENENVSDAENTLISHLNNSFGKRCALGYFYFLIEADGVLKYDLWCTTRLLNSAVSLVSDEFREIGHYLLPDMKKCPSVSCGCNYNYFLHDIYLKECKKNGYSEAEIFFGWNEKIFSKIRRRISKIFSLIRAA